MKCTMDRFDNIITGYSLILLVGGVIGYLVAGSLASLLMSSIFAILLIGSLFVIRISPQKGTRAILGLLVLLALFFGYRWYTIKFMPSGLLCIASLVVLGFAYSWRKKPVL